jgi:hypothetical protein
MIQKETWSLNLIHIGSAEVRLTPVEGCACRLHSSLLFFQKARELQFENDFGRGAPLLSWVSMPLSVPMQIGSPFFLAFLAYFSPSKAIPCYYEALMKSAKLL